MIEYVAIILILIGVFIAMAAYYKRSLQGKYKEAGDALSAGAQFGISDFTSEEKEKIGIKFPSGWR